MLTLPPRHDSSPGLTMSIAVGERDDPNSQCLECSQADEGCARDVGNGVVAQVPVVSGKM